MATTGFQQVKIDNNGTYGAYNPTTGQAIAFPDQASFAQYFPGQTPDPNAQLASFNTTGLLGANANTLQNIGNSSGSTVGGTPGSQPPVATPPPAPPDLSGMYANELASRGIGTGGDSDPLVQQKNINLDIANDQQVLAPLQNSNYMFPGSLKSLQDGGITQDQLNLKAAQAAAPIQTALSFLLQSQSAIGNYINQSSQFALNKTNLAQQQFQNQIASQPVPVGNAIIDANGNATQEMRNPTTGQITTVPLGNVGQPQGQYGTEVIGTHYDPLTGTQVPSYGIVNKNNGTVTPIGGTPLPTPIPNYNTSNPLDSSLPGSTPGSVFIPPTQGSTPPGSQQLAYQNNNPGNLRFANQPGATPGAGGFAKFSSPEAGYQALINQIKLDQSRGLSLSSFINKYAPPSENDTSTYLKQASATLGVNPNTSLSSLSANDIASFIAHKESGTTIVSSPQSAENPSITQAKQQISQTFPINSGAIQTTAFGHAFIDTTQVDPGLAQRAANLYGNGVIHAFDSQTTNNIKQLNTAYNDLTSLEPLLSSLPDTLLSPQAASNYIASHLNTDPSLARLRESWLAVLPELESQVGTNGISRLATGAMSNADFSILPSSTTPKAVAQAMLDQTRSLMGIRENSIFGGPPPPPNPTTFNNQILGSMQTTDPSMAIVNNVTNGSLNNIQFGGTQNSVDINKALAGGGLTLG